MEFTKRMSLSLHGVGASYLGIDHAAWTAGDSSCRYPMPDDGSTYPSGRRKRDYTKDCGILTPTWFDGATPSPPVGNTFDLLSDEIDIDNCNELESFVNVVNTTVVRRVSSIDYSVPVAWLYGENPYVPESAWVDYEGGIPVVVRDSCAITDLASSDPDHYDSGCSYFQAGAAAGIACGVDAPLIYPFHSVNSVGLTCQAKLVME
jgi:hypothetical protein